jgi:peptidoglycan/xylan/chitin deacetylase (PgdA/CDA1 family)
MIFKKVKSLFIKLLFQKRNNFFVVNRNKCFISFSFDDFPKSAANTGYAILKKYNLNATYYTSPSLFNNIYYDKKMADFDDLKFLASEGNEIGCHTYNHSVFNEVTNKQAKESMWENIHMMHSLSVKIQLNTFAYPKGVVTSYSKYLINKIYKSARTTLSGINVNTIDLNLLRANKLYSDSIRLEECFELIEECKKNNGWLIFYTHDVEKKPSKFGCTPEYFEEVVKYAVNSEVEILPVQDVINAIT